jgi:excisionase family DNA binding protein
MNEEEILTKEELAELLQVSKRTIERWIAECSIPFIKLPKRGSKTNVRFLKTNVLQWLKKNEKKPSGKFRYEETEEAA